MAGGLPVGPRLPASPGRPDRRGFSGSELPPRVPSALSKSLLLSPAVVFGVLSSLAETKSILGAQGDLKTCHYLTSYPSWHVTVSSGSNLSLFFFSRCHLFALLRLSRRIVLAFTIYHVFHKPCWFGVEENSLGSKLGLLRERGVVINKYARSADVNQDCPRQPGLCGLPGYGNLARVVCSCAG